MTGWRTGLADGAPVADGKCLAGGAASAINGVKDRFESIYRIAVGQVVNAGCLGHGRDHEHVDFGYQFKEFRQCFLFPLL